MLGKLFKHDFKAQYRIHCCVYLLIFISALAAFGTLKLQKTYPKAEIFDVVTFFALMIFVILMIGIVFLTFILSILRYRKNLLKDEGYLMHTLPVPVWNLHFSKMLASIFWYILDGIVMTAAISIVTGGFKWFRIIEMMAEVMFGIMPQDSSAMLVGSSVTVTQMAAEPSMGIKVFAVIGFLLYLLVGIISGLSQIYVSLCFGYTAYSSKDLMSFVAYIVTYIITQTLSMVGLVIVSLADFGSLSAMFGTEYDYMAETVNTGNYFMHVMVFAVILSIVLTVVYNFLSVRILKNKLNLE